MNKNDALNILILYLVFSLLCNNVKAQSILSWSQNIMSTSGGAVEGPTVEYNSPGRAFDLDEYGNSYLIGTTVTTTMDIDGGPGVYQLSNIGSNDIWVASYDEHGNVRWGFVVGSTGYDYSYGLRVDNHNNLWISGMFEGTIDLDPNGSGHTLNLSDGDRDFFIAKYDSAGNFLSAMQFNAVYNNPSAGYIYSMEFDDNDNLFIAGTYWGLVDFDTGSGIYNLPIPSNNNAGFVAKYDSGNNLLNAWSFVGSTEGAEIHDMKLDNQGGFYISGYYRGIMDADPGPGSYMISTNNHKGFTGRYTSSGDLLWVKQTMDDYQSFATVGDVHSDNSYTVGGHFSGPMSIVKNNGDTAYLNNLGGIFDYDFYMINYDDTGGVSWIRHLPKSDDNGRLSSLDAADNNTHVTFATTGSINMDNGLTNYTVAGGNFPDYDMGLASYEPTTGAFQAGFVWPNPGIEFCYAQRHLNAFYVFGSHAASIDLDTSAGVHLVQSNDVFFVKYCLLPAPIHVNEITDTLSLCDFSDYSINSTASGNIYWSNSAGDTLSTDSSFIITPETDSSFYLYLNHNRGCSNIFTDSIYVKSPQSFSEVLSFCHGDSLYVHNNYEKTSGVYIDTFFNVYGCDSISRVELLVLNDNSSSISISTCSSYTVPSGSETYATSGIYTDTLTNYLGCDSVITINLNIANSSSSLLNIIECDSYISPSGDETYFTSGIYQDTLTNSNGCDSLITINLSILQNSIAEISVVECTQYTVPSGDEIYFNSGLYLDTLPNVNGCDSVISIDLTILNSSTSFITINNCGSYTVPSGDETYITSGIYADTILNQSGCDSIISIDLTILPVDTSVSIQGNTFIANSVNSSYQWVTCDDYTIILGATSQTYTPFENGSYAVIVTNSNCIDTSSCHNIYNLSTDDIQPIQALVYPNPSGGKFFVYFPKPASGTVELIDMTGRQIDNKRIHNDSQVVFNAMHPSKGAYIIKFSLNSGVFQRQIVIQ